MSKRNRQPIFCTPRDSEDAPDFIKWSVANQGNAFDPEAGQYPDSFTLCAFDTKGPLAYLPVQQPMFIEPMMLESLAVRPDSTNVEIASALKELIQACVTIGYMKEREKCIFSAQMRIQTDSPRILCLKNLICRYIGYACRT